MASLESLANPLERTAVLPQSVNFNLNPLTGDPTWDVNRQYFQNDLVISGVDGGAYLLNGNSTTLLGGVDPALDGGANWQKTFPNGVSYYDSIVPAYATGGVGNTYVVTGINALPLPVNKYLTSAGSVWQITYQATATSAGPALAAADVVNLSFTADGAGAVSSTIDVVPLVGATATRFAGSCVVEVGTGGTGIVVGGGYTATNIQTLAGRLTFVRIF
jgi:hypothetical protein